MSIASELERLIDAKAAIRSAIAAQGVAVPSEATLDEYPGYIAMIEGGEPVDTAPAAFTSGQWTATAGVEQIEINITALPDDGGSVITALQYRLDGGSWVNLTGTGTGTRTITGLTGGVEYDVQLRAVNAIGNGAASDTKSRTPTASGGGTPGEMVFGNNTGDTHTLTAAFFNQYGNSFFAPGVDRLTVDSPAAKATNLWSVTMLRPDLATLPAGATITSVTVEGYVFSRWQTPTAHVHRCLRAVELASSSVPGIADYATGQAWGGESASGVGDKSASLSSVAVPESGAVTIPSSPSLVAAVQSWADGSRAAPLWLILGSTGTSDDSFELMGTHTDEVADGQRIRVRIEYTA